MRAITPARIIIANILLAATLVATSPASALDACNLRYSLTPLDITPPPNAVSDLVGVVNINNRAQIIGFYIVDVFAPTGRAFIWSREDPVARDLGDLGGPGSFPADINDRGTIVGASNIPPVGIDLFPHAFRWRDGVMHDLGTLGGVSSVALGINNWGFIVGAADIAEEDERHAVLWSPRGRRMRDLGTLGGLNSRASAINIWGQVVGSSETLPGAFIEHAFLWLPQDRVIRDLGTLGGDNSSAVAINDRGQVAGFSEITPGGCRHAFFWDGQMQDLGTLGGGQSEATGISIWGQVVGSSEITSDPAIPCEGPEHAFIWTKQCGMRDLNTLTVPPPPTPLSEVVINDLGQMVAGDVSDEGAFWFLLKPVLWPWSAVEQAKEE